MYICTYTLKQIYHNTDDACTLTEHASAMVLSRFTCISVEPKIFARAALMFKCVKKKQTNFREKNLYYKN